MTEVTPSFFVIDRSALFATGDSVMSDDVGEQVPFPLPLHVTVGPEAVVNPDAEAVGVNVSDPAPEYDAVAVYCPVALVEVPPPM